MVGNTDDNEWYDNRKQVNVVQDVHSLEGDRTDNKMRRKTYKTDHIWDIK